jgi:hypothetical protein
LPAFGGSAPSTAQSKEIAMRAKALFVAAAFGLCTQPAQAQSPTLPTPVPAPPRPTPLPPRPIALRPLAVRPAPPKPPADDLAALTEAQREKECNRRVPLDADGGRSYEKQLAFGKCMGPRWGEGG